MTFAKCIGGEPERVFASPAAREMPPSKLKMRQLLGWARNSSSNNSSKRATPPASPQQLAQSPVVRDAKTDAGRTPPLSPVPPKAVRHEAASARSDADADTTTSERDAVDVDDSDAPEQKLAAPPAPFSRQQQQQHKQQQHGEHDDADADANDANQQEPEQDDEGGVSPSPPPPPSVVYRKGEKSFLDFHQDYAITRHLGEGSYSTVKQVTHRTHGGFFACKIVDKAALSAVDRAALSQEVLVLSRVSHDNIMRLYEVIEDDSKCYLVTELAEHGDLFDKILRTHRFNVRFPSKDWGHVDPSVKELVASMLHITPSQRPSAAHLRAHPWVRQGRAILDQLRREAEERKRLAELTRKQQTADSIRKKLTMGGFEVVKYGRNGLPHRTKLRFSNDARSVTWQPKLLKRSLLRYQNARSFTSLFGLAKESNSTSQPQLHAHPQIDRLSACDGAVGRRSESATQHDNDSRSEHRDSSLSSTGSNSSSASTASSSSVGEKKLWWKAFRRDRGKAERTASGGFSLSFSAAARPSAVSFDSTTRAESDDATECGRSSAGTAPGAGNAPDKLDDSINLSDIRSLAAGDQSEFFAAHKANLPNGCKRAVDPGCVLSITTRFRELHLEFPNVETRDGFAFLLEQTTLPLQPKAAPARQRYANATRHSSSSDKEGDSTEFEDARQFAPDDDEEEEEGEGDGVTTEASEPPDNNATESE
ncbi:hypothetical protein PybrP1_002400 [[Pythium] brassicae (nom. inval.)]|nr:hypothetical protein PybrP1_002400 [[Pythium] brassicae (nom. inval.)]